MRIYLLILFVVLFLVSCASVTITKEERQSIKTVSVEKPVLADGALHVKSHLGLFTEMKPYKGNKYSDLNSLHQAVYEDNNIDIKELVYKELIEQMDGIGGFERVESGGDLVVKPVIAQYGYFTHGPFTSKLSPKCTINYQGSLANGKIVWQASGIARPFDSTFGPHENQELVDNPELILNGFKSSVKAATTEAMNAYKELVK